ncbi:isopeptide-forming domain-containing fimbrial protein [Bifidobacterium ruminantium]|uniref:SpaA isopeptide-forming pilin-related protein n=1 Tax=Bifidobacterium ruminantium TaxID=78346 RepID=UPI00195A463A|nr:SpaA isopeptide-forming pilin-related protein [Bifidobacterium ruminantium]MBM6746400.1 isopeptide-forming domain-containing fimbrial protein [Bifidobacterium ruminantium]
MGKGFHFDAKRLAAACAAAATLMGCGFATTAMAAPATVNDATTNTAITLNAAEGNTLDGHTFTFYRLGSYGDIIGNGDKDVSSLTVLKIDDATDQWIAAANKTAGVTDYQGYDAAGDLAHVANTKDPKNDLTDNHHNNAANADPADSGNGVQKTLRKAAKALAGSVPAAVKPAATVTGHGTTQTTTPLANGLYLVVDSHGSPMIVGTPIQGAKTLNGVTLGTLTIKAKTVNVDKKAAQDRENKTTWVDAKDTETPASWRVGDTVDFRFETTLPNKQNAYSHKVVDVMHGMTLSGSPAVTLKTGGTDITKAAGVTVTPGANGNGFTVEFSQDALKAYSAKRVVVTYKALITSAGRGDQASNTATASTRFYDGGDVDPNDPPTTVDKTIVAAYDLNLVKTNWDGTRKLAGAGFRIRNVDTGKWMTLASNGQWSDDQTGVGTEFKTNADGKVNFAGLGAGKYRIEETTVPAGMVTFPTALVKIDFTVADNGTITVTKDDNNLKTGFDGDKDRGYTLTAKNVDSLTQLPQTGGAFGMAAMAVVAVVGLGGVMLITIRSRRGADASDGVAA